MEAKVTRTGSAHPGTRKYLVRWTLRLGPDEIQKISARPDVLERVLDHVNRATRGSKFEVYRIVPLEEVAHSVRPVAETAQRQAHPSGIAIAEAGSMEEVKTMVENLLKGVSFGGLTVPMENYLEFEINPLAELVHGGSG